MDVLDSFTAVFVLKSAYVRAIISAVYSGAKRALEQGVVGIFVTSSAPVTATLAVQKSACGHSVKK